MSRDWFYRILLVMAGVLICLLIIDIVLTQIYHGYSYPPDKRAIETATAIIKESEEYGCLNTKGIWDRPIVLLGDSFTGGGGVAPNESYPFYLQQILDDAFGRCTYQVVNLGLSDSTALAEDFILRRYLNTTFVRPIVLHMLVTNDFGQSYYQFDPVAYCNFTTPLSYDISSFFLDNFIVLRFVYNRIAIMSGDYFPQTGHPVYRVANVMHNYSAQCSSRVVHDLSQSVRSSGGEYYNILISDSYFWSFPKGQSPILNSSNIVIDPFIEYFNLTINESVLDLTRLFVEDWEYERLYAHSDYYHYSPDANQLIARQVFDFLNKTVFV